MMKSLFGVFALGLIQYASSQYTYCDDSYECSDSTISTTYALCYGYFGCDNTTITSTYTYAWGTYSNYISDITSTYTYAYGIRSNYFADVAGYYIYSYGYLASQYAEIEPSGTYLALYAYGLYTGYYSDVSCYSGDTCKIECGRSYGCYLMDYYCYSGANCYYNCDNDETCPTLYSGVEADISLLDMDKLDEKSITGLTDEEIDRKKAERRAIKTSKFEKEIATGKMDEDDYNDLIERFNAKGEPIPQELQSNNIKLLFNHGMGKPGSQHRNNNNNNNNNEQSSSPASVGYVNLIIAAIVGAMVVLGLQMVYKMCKYGNKNEKLTSSLDYDGYQAISTA